MGQEQHERWHLDPKVTLTIIGWLVVASMSGVGWAFSVSRDLSALQAQLAASKDANRRQDEVVSETLRNLRDDMRELRTQVGKLQDQMGLLVSRDGKR